MQIIAHRGASGEFPENSLLAFEQAIAQRCDGIELDVQFHQASQCFIVLHDQYVNKVTSAQGHINDFTLEQLTQLSLGQHQTIVTLPQALATIAGRTLVNIELKSLAFNLAELTAQIAQLQREIEFAITHHHFERQQFIISSFNHPLLLACKQQLPDITRAALIAHLPIELTSITDSLACQFINFDIDAVNKQQVEIAHQLGLKVWLYTVDEMHQIAQCRQLNVDGIFTNFPKTSRAHLALCQT